MNMKKIVFYGVANCALRNKAEHYLDDNYIVIGYTDSFYTEDILQGKRFIPLEKLAIEEFDYIVILAASVKNQNLIKENLRRIGVMKEKILCPFFLYNDSFYYTPDLRKELKFHLEKNNLEQGMDVVLGLSYSLKGIDERRLEGNFYDFSWHSLDLYYNLRLLKEAGKINTALLCFPYYYFDLDMSKSLEIVSKPNFWAIRGFEDWHNALNGNEDIIEYITIYDMFGKHFFAETEGRKYWKTLYEILDKEDGSCELSPIWKREYKETFEENGILLEELLRYLSKMKSKIIFVVPPHLYLPCIKEELYPVIETKKKRFYQLINSMQESYSFEVIDAFEIMQDKIYWADQGHLNEAGKQEFTNFLRKVI